MKPSSRISVDFSTSGAGLRPAKPAHADSREEQGLPGFSSRYESAVQSDKKQEVSRQKNEPSASQQARAEKSSVRPTEKKQAGNDKLDGAGRHEAAKATAKETSKDAIETADADETQSEGNEEHIRAEAEALLDRLNASSQQLQTAKDGKELPPESDVEAQEIDAAAFWAAGNTTQPGQVASQTGDVDALTEGDAIMAGRQGKLAQLLAAQTQTAADGKANAPELSALAGAVQSATLGDSAATTAGESQPDWLSDAIARLTASKGGEAGLQDGGQAGQQSGAQSGMTAGLNAALMDAGLQLDGAQTDSPATSQIGGQQNNLQSLAAGLQRGDAAQAQQPPLPLQREMAGEQLAERVQMLMSKNLKHVDIRLDPPELGRLQIKLHINQDQASVQFNVSNAQTRDLIEQAMPRLRELLQQQGIQLAQGSVQQDSGQQLAGQQAGGQQQGTGNSGGGRHAEAAEEDAGSAVAMTVSEQRDGIDYYA
ncbi:flagellar hook-length control protein FliK [Photobacterium sp. 1_MG-2023]|uniref:flagellar hook-length control protein FliK n=1 Tax=Photobacterium sp. 1_MG-2023 TaxID=3062646 RepID=UPI0026E359F9|nr:flagellar hook-length control protein FliK [Photobacterium sp. 1_MG-2023]MDO6705188.1 flagellar hook-length control protein FliK [Photobacterium sp. 1_MG-2023]